MGYPPPDYDPPFYYVLMPAVTKLALLRRHETDPLVWGEGL